MHRPRPANAALLVGLALALAAAPAWPQGSRLLAGFASFGKNKIQYRDFDWRIYHSPHFDVYYYTEEEVLLQKVVSMAESAYDQLSREFDFQIEDPTPLIFYATHSAFEQNNIILNFIPEGVGAFATPARNRMVLPVDLPDPELYALILHELTHIFEYHILFQNRLSKTIATQPPQWVMEGLASYMAKDEEAWEKMFLRDAVVNDRVPSITQSGVQGYFAYRFGHAAFDFMEERWGKEGLRDFLYEFRNTLGSSVEPAVEKALGIEPEEFDLEFRRWLRRTYLPRLVETGEPSDFGRVFRTREEGPLTDEISATASPSGDLVAAFSTARGSLDVVLFDAEKRRLIRNLTSSYSKEYQYLTAQFLTTRRIMGRDLAFSPDGNTIAVFAKKERGRALLLLDVLNGGIRRAIEMEIEQQLAPAWSPDGRTLAFAGWQGGQFDIFLFDVEGGTIRNLTADDLFDGAPTFSPDGASLVYSSVVGGYAKLFRLNLENPAERFQLTSGEFNDTDAAYSPDGTRIYFSSDRGDINNIYSLDLDGGEIQSYTDVVTGCFMPTVLRNPEGGEEIVYTGFWKGGFNLYVTGVDEPVADPILTELAEQPVALDEIPRFEPAVEVAIDDANKEKYGGFKLFLEDADAFLGVTDDQTFVGRTVLIFSDYLGDKRLITAFSSVSSFQNFDIVYLDLSERLQWSIYLFDDRDFFFGFDETRGRLERGRQFLHQTGAIASLTYPFSFYHRVEGGVGYLMREIDLPVVRFNPETGRLESDFQRFEDDFPLATASLVGDTVLFAQYGPVAGRRWRLDGSYAPDLDGSGTLASTVSLDARQYLPVTRRSGFAVRLYGGLSEGNRANVIYFGGLDTLRGFDFRSLAGDRAFFTNIEFRFPLIDYIQTPLVQFQGVRGRVFLDVGGAWFDSLGEEFDFWNDDESRLADAVSSYGYGVTLRLYGLDLNWDFGRQWDFKESLDEGYQTSFWVGTRF